MRVYPFYPGCGTRAGGRSGRSPVRARKGRRRLSRICRLGRSLPPPRADASPRGDKCGSVAYTADGAFGAAYGMDNCDDAERLAVDECVRESTDKPDCSRGAVTKRDTWFYIQFCRQGSEWTTHVTTKQTLSGVNQDAAEWARKSKYGNANCRLVPNGLLHSGGLHTKM